MEKHEVVCNVIVAMTVSFQLDYLYEANKLGVAEKIVDTALNGSGIWDTRRVLGVSATTVIAYLKKLTPQQSHQFPSANLIIKLG
ncbi:MAG: IS1-like element transposase [Pseudomonadota bacterium]